MEIGFHKSYRIRFNAEFVVPPTTPDSPLTLLRSYTWAGDEPAALTTHDPTTHTATTYYYTLDANKNVSELTDSTGTVVAHYEYGPFGQVTVKTGAMADANQFRFSSEYAEDELGLVYYNFRHYDPETGRWLSRDPIEENGGMNLYGFVRNNSVSFVDNLGLALFAFDGTNNDGARDSKKNHETNVHILYDAYSNGQAYYYPGVGTNDGIMNPVGSASGWGVNDRANKALDRLANEKDDEPIDIIGFSRGAAEARTFANRVREKYPCRNVRYLGLFDTVASTPAELDLSTWNLKDTRIYHIIATRKNGKGERRFLFPCTSVFMNPDPSRDLVDGNWAEIPVNGTHSDIGGWYSDNRVIANRTLKMMYDDMVAHKITMHPLDIKYANTDPSKEMIHNSDWLNDFLVNLVIPVKRSYLSVPPAPEPKPYTSPPSSGDLRPWIQRSEMNPN